MSTRWFYSRAGDIHGPLSAEEIKALAEGGKITDTDLVWPEGSAPEDRLPAQAVLMTKGAVRLPDWLDDVREDQRTGPLPPPEPCHDSPEWIEDLRLWIALDLHGQAIPWDDSLGPPPLQTDISRDVEEWFREATEAPPVKPAPRGEAAKPVSAPRQQKESVPIARPVEGPPALAAPPKAEVQVVVPAASPPPPPARPPVAAPVMPPVGPAPRAVPPPKAEVQVPAGSPPPPPAKPPVVAPVAPPAAPPVVARVAPPPAPPVAPGVAPRPAPQRPSRVGPAARNVTDLLAEQALKESGFDPRTGEVRDAVRFQHWKQKQAHAAAQAPCSNAGLMEAFRKARTEVEGWLDLESGRPLVLALDLAAIRSHPDVQAILNNYEGYGATFRNKLLRHLDFMAENRCKYYTARPEG